MSKTIQLSISDPSTLAAMDQINKRLDSIEEKLPKPLSKLITRKQVSEMLSVSVVTIIDWDKKKILNPLRIGNRVRYQLSEIEEVLKSSRYES
ncbi:helix-turn-helix domain-containing protein [Nonlabens ulvanivorans]|uniref:helix-turn-helix domain-containing protein n=1 Tax=Nonlabens ulvanivorans TaxID=906888 RepID=UPI0037CB0065